MIAMSIWEWLGHAILPSDGVPPPDAAAERSTDAALADAEVAHQELQQLKRRARAVGIDVDVERGRSPHGTGLPR